MFKKPFSLSSWDQVMHFLIKISKLSLIPLFSTIMAILFFKEKFQFFHLIGAILIILGLFLSNREIKDA